MDTTSTAASTLTSTPAPGPAPGMIMSTAVGAASTLPIK